MYFFWWLGFKKYVILKRYGFVSKLYLNIPYPVVQLYQNIRPMLYYKWTILKNTGFYSVTNRGIVPKKYTERKPV